MRGAGVCLQRHLGAERVPGGGPFRSGSEDSPPHPRAPHLPQVQGGRTPLVRGWGTDPVALFGLSKVCGAGWEWRLSKMEALWPIQELDGPLRSHLG